MKTFFRHHCGINDTEIDDDEGGRYQLHGNQVAAEELLVSKQQHMNAEEEE